MSLGILFSRRWLLTTFIVFVGVGVLTRLGIWQLDRLAQRRAFNQRVVAQLDGQPINLNLHGLELSLYDNEFRSATVTGTYDYSTQISLRNRVVRNRIGVNFLTPLLLTESDQVILVDRGWIPADQASPDQWEQFELADEVQVTGVLRRSELIPPLSMRPDPTVMPGQSTVMAWNMVNLDQIAVQNPDLFTSVYLQEEGAEIGQKLPYTEPFELEISEGPHQNYAIQWFLFAGMLLIGYPFFVKSQEQSEINEVS
ncbi:MAG: SURF1 family protein [Chloroflexota bacterium]